MSDLTHWFMYGVGSPAAVAALAVGIDYLLDRRDRIRDKRIEAYANYLADPSGNPPTNRFRWAEKYFNDPQHPQRRLGLNLLIEDRGGTPLVYI